MDEIIKLFKALSDKSRLRILMVLSHKSLCVCELQCIIKIAMSTVSQHLAILVETGLIKPEKRGKWIYYSIDSSNLSFLNANIIMLLSYILNKDEYFISDLIAIKSIEDKNLCDIKNA